MHDDVRLGRRVALVGLGASAFLAATNIAVGLKYRSTSIFATGVEFAGDVLASALVLFGMTMAAKPADENHPYGHGRLETLAAFVIGLALSAGGAGICWNSLQEVGAVHPPPPPIAAAVLAVAIVIRGLLSVVKFRVGRRIRSASLLADAWNDSVDILAACAALTAVGLTIYNNERFLAADHYGGFVVGVVVIITGIRVLRETSLELIDTMPDVRLMAEVRSVAMRVPGVRGVDKAYARKTGLQYHVDLHVEVDPAMSVAEAHAAAGQVRRRVRAELGWVADVLVHVEPSRGEGDGRD